MKDKFQLLKELYADESEYVFKPRKLEDNEPQQGSQNENTLWFDLQGNMHFSKENYSAVTGLTAPLQRYTSLYYEFIEKDLTKVKQAFYQYGRISEFLLKKYDSDELSHSGLFTFSHIILSDNLALIKRFADFKPIKYGGREYVKDIEKGRLTHMGILQSIIKEDWQECKHLIEILKVKNKQFKLDVSFYEYLINGDTKNIKSVLKKFVSKPVHNRRNSGLLGEFISYPAVGYAKLAWNMGINVEINSPLIPKDWLPIQPLKDEEYIDYDFVKDYFNS